MRERAIADLDQLPDNRFFQEVAAGLQHVAENAITIDSDACALGNQDRPRGERILRAIAEEEAAKYLILLDAVRCQRGGSRRLAAHLVRFNQHLAKGLYANCCELRPATFGELRAWIDRDREQYYLDGPNDIDWIFRNSILQQREESFYVDYVENDGEHSWQSPQHNDRLRFGTFYKWSPAVIRLVTDLDACGFSDERALALVAEKWRPVEITDECHFMTLRTLNYETLKALEAANILREKLDDVYRRIVDEWGFPLYSLDLGEIKIPQAGLRERQERWTPDNW